jgi:glycosyltransferase involved in cell wall biosynthesis
MKISFLVVKDILNGGGIERYTREVGKRLVQRGHSVTVYSTRGTNPMESTLHGMRIIWLPRLQPHWCEKPAGALTAAFHQLSNSNTDVVHLHSVVSGAMAGLIRFLRVPCVVQMHGVEWQRSRWSAFGRSVLKQLERLSFRYGDVFTAVSKVQCEYYSSRFNVPIHFIPTAADVKDRVPLTARVGSLLRPGSYVLTTSRLVPEKGLHYLIDAFRRLRTDWDLVIAGDGPEMYAKGLRELAGSDHRIQFVGHVNGALLDQLYSNAGVFVQPSEIEGLAISLLEAMSFGLPCVASDIPENREALGAAGLTFKSKEVEDLCSKLEFSISNQALLAPTGAAARSRVAQLYSWDGVTNSLESLYQDMLQPRSLISIRDAAITTPIAGRTGPGNGTQAWTR